MSASKKILQKNIGKTENGLPIFSYTFENTGKSILILGGVHGDEIEGVALAWALLEEIEKNPIPKLKFTFVPQFNFDGILNKTRHNARGVDLNRNLPTKDWDKKAFNPRYNPGEAPNTESENQALVKFLNDNTFDFIISLHSFSKYLLNVNGNCEPVASKIHELTGYPIEESMGYPTPGCLGTYTGLERNIPTLTYELERGKDVKDLIAVHVPAVVSALKLL